jgi:hypothetical protein
MAILMYCNRPNMRTFAVDPHLTVLRHYTRGKRRRGIKHSIFRLRLGPIPSQYITLVISMYVLNNRSKQVTRLLLQSLVMRLPTTTP